MSVDLSDPNDTLYLANRPTEIGTNIYRMVSNGSERGMAVGFTGLSEAEVNVLLTCARWIELAREKPEPDPVLFSAARDALREHIAIYGKEQTLEFLSSYKATKLSDVAPEELDSLIVRCKSFLPTTTLMTCVAGHIIEYRGAPCAKCALNLPPDIALGAIPVAEPQQPRN